MESQGETVLVVVNANRGGKGSMEALNWALKSIVRPRDTVIVLGVIFESCSKLKSSCFPFLMHIDISGLCKFLYSADHDQFYLLLIYTSTLHALCLCIDSKQFTKNSKDIFIKELIFSEFLKGYGFHQGYMVSP